jgi:hypothetical protein
MQKNILASWVLLFGIFLVPFRLMADDAPALHNTQIYVGAEEFKWTEVQGSTTVLEDSGLRGTVGIGWSNLFIPSGGAVYRANITLYGGMPSNECATTSPTLCPTAGKSDSRYAGIKFEGMGGYRFGSVIGTEIFSGVSTDFWSRSIQGSTTISGYDTYYAVANVKLGASLLQRFNSFGYFLRFGVKAPVLTWERIDILDGVEVRPKPHLSSFASLDLTFGTVPRDRFVLSIYYDSYRFGQSKPRLLTNNSIPVTNLGSLETKMDAIGVQAVFGF